MRSSTRSASVGVLVGALVFAAAVPASAAHPINCGSPAGNANIGIVTSGTNYQARETNSHGNSYLQAAVQWRSPVVGAPLNWYFGPFEKVTTTYSDTVPNINYPSRMAGTVWYNANFYCDVNVVASNW